MYAYHVRYIKWEIAVAPWLQKSSKTKIIHGIIGIPIQHIVPKEKIDY